MNAAARLVSLNAEFGTSVLITDAVYRAVSCLFVCRFVGTTKLGASEVGTPVYTIHGLVENPLLGNEEWNGGNQSIAACLIDLTRIGASCPALIAECADQYSIGIRCAQRGALGEAAEVFCECLTLLNSYLEVPEVRSFASPDVASSFTSIILSDIPRKASSKLPLHWLVGQLPQNLENQIRDCQRRLSASK